MPELKPQKYVVVLAHADGWGALSANKIVRHIHEHYPDVGIHLVVSQATKNKDGEILTKLEDLKAARLLKETNLLEYFRCVDEMYDHFRPPEEVEHLLNSGELPEGMPEEQRVDFFVNLGKQQAHQLYASLLTFKQLAKRYCADQTVHYTTRGGPKGGEEVAAVIAELEKQHGYGPEVLLSVDTMAILPKELLERYQCFSTHPGPLDTIKIEGMQGTLRSLASQVLYGRDGEPLPVNHVLGIGEAYIKGTLFMQHPELDKGPPIALAQTFVCPGMCAYQARDEIYHALIDEMITRLPVLLDKEKRAGLVEQATKEKEKLNTQPHKKIPELEPEKFATWQGQCVGVPDEDAPHGLHIIQNEIVSPQYFKNQMRRFFPGQEADFKKIFAETYGAALEKIETQKDDRLTDPWAKYYRGDTDVTIQRHDPKTGAVIAEFKNPSPPGKARHE